MSYDLSGKRFGRLVAESIYHKDGKRFWLCRCDCGEFAIVRTNQLVSGRTTSCGCYMRERRLQNLKRCPKKSINEYENIRIDGHNKKWNAIKHQYPRIYSIWHGMKSRCNYPKNKCYHHYGGRGISVCKEWDESFNTFANWALTNGYADNLSIDRIDVNGNYCPENCRWVTNAEQQRNKRKSPSRTA